MMAGIEDIIEIYRGESVNLNPFKKRSSFFMNEKGKETVGKFVTDKASEARNYARKFPSVIKSTKVPRETFAKFKDVFDDTIFKQPKYPTDSRFFYGLIDDPNKLKVDILKTLGVNIKNLTPLAVKGLNMMASLPVATITAVLQSTPANADEANMTLEDFAKLNEGNTNVDKSLPVEVGDI
jgi:hypothetical protein|tara:strand:+ start:60 stop:602 length:543 start_codon:yes stop_codon:yes gene_type:complete